jgi:hypothetical protein
MSQMNLMSKKEMIVEVVGVSATFILALVLLVMIAAVMPD